MNFTEAMYQFHDEVYPELSNMKLVYFRPLSKNNDQVESWKFHFDVGWTSAADKHIMGGDPYYFVDQESHKIEVRTPYCIP